MAMDDMAKKFHYVHSCDVDANVHVKIGSLEGTPTEVSFEEVLNDPNLKFSGRYFSECSDFYVECSVHADGRMLGFPVQTSYKPFTTRWSWNEWVALPLKFCDLPRNAMLCMTIYDCHGPGKRAAVGGTTVSFFGRYGQFREGIHDLKVWKDVEADGSENSTTAGKLFKEEHQEMRRLSKLVKKHRAGLIPQVDWLDRMTFREIELINEREKKATKQMYLMLEFPRFEHQGIQYTVVYFEPDGEEAFQVRSQTGFPVVPDPELFQENLVEAKHQKLARSLRSGLSDRDLKPNSSIRDALQKITQYPPTQNLTSEEQDLVWRYRFYLTANKKALAKFLHCVPWSMKDACKQASELIAQWAPPDPEDALELLGPKYDAYSAQNMVRKYAVTRLKEAPDDDLLLYLLQLVQALKYENLGAISAEVDTLSDRGSVSVTASFGVMTGSAGASGSPSSSQMAASDDSLAGSLSDISQSDKPRSSSKEDKMVESTGRRNSATDSGGSPAPPSFRSNASNGQIDAIIKPVFNVGAGGGGGSEDYEYGFGHDLDLASFLIHRSCHNTVLASYFHWYLLIECEDPPDHSHASGSAVPGALAANGGDARPKADAASIREMYLAIMKRFRHALMKSGKECRLRRSLLSKQQLFVDKLVNLMKTIARESGNRGKKIERLRSLLSDPQSHKLNLSSFDPLPFPLDPEIKIVGVLPEKSTLFKSSLMPAKLTFRTSENTDVVAIFKHGDDLRQDQLILQMIILMDKLMRRDHLDLKLTPYQVLATSTKHGFVQYVDSKAIAEILTHENTIQNYLRKNNPSEVAPYGIAADVMDNYVCSCAGYCVITYLLGVGDRHLDNLLLTKSGRLFHIDFGYILGRDPKPMPPPMKLSREMVEAMGGPASDHYQEFKRKCFLSFLYLRRHANLIINLFTLMIDANVPDIALEPDKTVRKVQDKFCLHMSDEEAVQYIKGIIDESVSAVMPVLVEQIHKFAQYWRK